MNDIDKTRYYKDFYACTASISKTNNGYRLIVKTSQGKSLVNKPYPTERGAKIVLCTLSDSMTEIKNVDILGMEQDLINMNSDPNNFIKYCVESSKNDQ